MSEVQGEDLLAELNRKENDLILAAEFGKKLLDEKERLKQDLSALKADLACLEEMLESQKQESLKSKKLAEVHISDLETELDSCRSCLELERVAASSAREEFRRSCRQLEKENSHLKEHLTQVMEKHEIELEELNRRLLESRKQSEVVLANFTSTHHSLQQLQGQNQRLDKNLFSVSRSCERLSLELNDSRDVAGFWESQCHSQEELLHSQAKELDDSKNQLKLLQMQLDQKHMHGVMASRESLSSGVSLYEELSQLDEVEQRVENTSVVSYSSDNDSSVMEDDKVVTLPPACTVAEVSPTSLVMEKQERGDKLQETVTEGLCQRCQRFETENKRLENELRNLNEQLLIAVQQKFKLQQQVEEWQCDMAVVVDTKLQRKLAKEKSRWAKSKHKQDLSCCREDGGGGEDKANSRSRLALHILKNSRLF